MKELAVFLQNVVQGGPGVNIEVREGRGRCLVANKQIEVGDVPVNIVHILLGFLSLRKLNYYYY